MHCWMACARPSRDGGRIPTHVSEALEGTISCRVRRYDTLLLELGRFSLQRQPVEF